MAETDIVLITPGREWQDGDPEIPNSLVSYAKLLALKGWQYKLGYAHSFHPGKPYADVDRDDRHPDQEIHLWWVDAAKVDKGRVSITFSKTDDVGDKPRERRPTCWSRRINRNLSEVSDADMKAWIKDD